jgi:hypothetical protein
MHHSPKRTAVLDARRIIVAACHQLEVDVDRLRGSERAPEVQRARQLTCYVLRQAGYTLVEIAQLLGRDHSTVLYALRRVDESAALAEQGWELVEGILPFLEDRGEEWPVIQIPDEALPRALLRPLWGRCSLPEMRAVRAYVLGPLLGHERVRPAQAVQGYWVIAMRPEVRQAVETVLEASGYGAHVGVLRHQLARERRS